MSNFREELGKRILVLDGAMGTAIQNYKLSEEGYRGEFKELPGIQKGNNELLNLSRPEIIKEIHKNYILAGADIIETNTFNGTEVSLKDYGIEDRVYDVNFRGVELVKEAIKEVNPHRKIYIAGAIGPTNKTASMSPDVENSSLRSISFDELKVSYKEQAKALLDGGVDVFLVETIFDTLNAKAVIYAIDELCLEEKIDIPIMISGTIIDKSGRTLAGQTLEAFSSTLNSERIVSMGLNCAFGAKDLVPFLKRLSNYDNRYISVYPNAGLPNELGEYDENPEDTVELLKELIDGEYINVVGGCCGTTPLHIKALKEATIAKKPKTLKEKSEETIFTGLEPLKIDINNNFINIGERTNVAGSRKFCRLITEKKYDEALQIAREQVENGAQIIDINLDDALLESKEEMKHFINLISSDPEIARVPFMIDSSKWEVILEGIKSFQGKSIVNSISLKEGEEDFINKALEIKRYGSATVIMAFDEKGQADSYERKIEICKRAYDILVEKVGFNPCDIIFDPNIFAIGTGIEEHANYAVDFIRAVRWIKENLPHAKTSGGISNVSFSFRGNNVIREAIHAVFLYHAIDAGLDMGILNPGLIQVYEEIDKELLGLVEDVVFNKKEEATENLIEYAQRVKDKKLVGKVRDMSWRKEDLDSRLSHSLVKGTLEYLETDLDEALKTYTNPVDIIEKPLMNGMDKVGELFGSGKMFLPQVVKSARAMKKAVNHLLPHIEKDKAVAEKSGKILMATVKGDVHDIGKNIVGVVLGCNNFEIIDLGVMVPCEEIIRVAKEENVDAIGLSGLITPSLEEMTYVASELEKEGLDIPIIIGGATTSKLHTALKIEPNYKKRVVHVLDASSTIPVVKKLCSQEREEFLEKVSKEYEALRETYGNKKKREYISLEEARKNGAKFSHEDISEPKFLGKKKLEGISIEKLEKYIDWTYFNYSWGIKGTYPKILEDPNKRDEVTKLMTDARKYLKILAKENISVDALIGFYEAYSEGDDVTLKIGSTKKEKFSFVRQQIYKEKDNLCISDFIAPKDNSKSDYLGIFAGTVTGIEDLTKKYRDDDYSIVMIKILGDRLVEACAEYLHEKVRKDYWGYAREEELTINEIFDVKYRGIRPAIGYPSLPEHSDKEITFRILDANKELGIELTESFAMAPASSVCGLILAHPESRYFDTGKISKDQIEDLAKRKGKSVEYLERILATKLNYK